MKIKFVSDQQYQIDAVNSIVNIFEGQKVRKSDFTITFSDELSLIQTELGIGNKLDLLDDELLTNVQKIQMENGLPKSSSIQGRNFTVEMETGTGKTYIYIRTIYELNKKYGFTKFIIVVPSVAIREGVYKTLQITKDHFQDLYDNQPCNYFIYDSSKLGQVRGFATSNNIEIMIINIDAFRKSFVDPDKQDKANIIHRENDRLSGRKPIEFICQTNPIVIIDEPQSVDNTDKAKEAIASLNPLCIFRYSATHREKYNLMYRLDPVDAYEKKLVKEIEVSTVKAMDNYNKPYIKLLSVSNKNGFKANIELDIKTAAGVRRTTKTVKLDADLYDISGERDLYEGYVLSNIDCTPGNEDIEFRDGTVIQIGQSIGDFDEDDIKRAQITTTIQKHLDKELKLLPKGIKVLSLFFIDKVENYRVYNSGGKPQKGKYAIMFEEEYAKLINMPKYRTIFKDDKYLLNYNASEVHDGYFSVDNKGKVKDTKGDTQADYDTYSLIMKDKEKLLSFDTPLRFIFSHSALKEGWDNPNVFQVCTLVETRDILTKRQKIGRGLRLAVNQDGERVYGHNINVLTVMANESFADFAAGLQKEIEEETGVKFGIIERYTFASIPYLNAEGYLVNLGFEESEKIWNFLHISKLIESSGKVTDKLKKQIRDEKFDVPEEYNHLKIKIIEVIKKSVSKLNIKNSDDGVTVAVNKQLYLSQEFEELWNRIKNKTTYSVNIDIGKLIENCISGIKSMPTISKQKFVQEVTKANIKRSGVEGELLNIRYIEQTHVKNQLPDILRYIQDETKLTRKTIIKILTECGRLDDFKNNSQKFMEVVSDTIKKSLRHLVLDGIKYEKIDGLEYYKQEVFEVEELKGYLNSNVIDSTKSIYEKVIYDSDTERAFAERMEKDEDVKLYVKLPSKFLVETPIGNYNPDWAVLIEKNGVESLYFVIETKGSLDEDQLRFYEGGKIICGRKHFEALGTGIEYKVANDYFEFKSGI